MERAETIDYSVRASAPGASNPELMDTTSASIPSELLASPTFPEKQSNLSDEEHCARITTVIKKKDIAQNLYDAYVAALTGYSIDDDDLKQLKKRHDDLQLAMREVLDKNPLLNMQADYFLRQSVTIRQRKERLSIVWTLKKILRHLEGSELTVIQPPTFAMAFYFKVSNR
ncbi:hypothetical protein CDAR_178101 [Caerostris darwini]|uniref:Uncharacterized protein n=1 Tax=Caerostris darwini TaxID=1538125 RepID=A0AAV4PMG5_9ARAC|nr:hypothetical protein CDAR_178101 [Caerostris darwini]